MKAAARRQSPRRAHANPIGVVLGLFVALSPALARAAATCKDTNRPFVAFTAEVLPPDQLIADTLARHLTAELEARGIDLCEGPEPPRKAVARVALRIERSSAGPTTAVILIGDAVTDKRVERTLDLTPLPADSRALSVAAAADELLRASWAELLIADAPKPVTQAAPAIVAAVETTLRPQPSRLRRFETGVVATSSMFAHRTGLGASLLFGHAIAGHISALFRTGFERGLSTSSVNGTTRADTTSFGIGLEYAINEGALGVHLTADTRIVQVHYAATALPGRTSHDATDFAWLSGWGPRFCLDVGAARVQLGAAALIGVRPSRANDDGREVSSLGRLGGELTLGVSLRL